MRRFTLLLLSAVVPLSSGGGGARSPASTGRGRGGDGPTIPIDGTDWAFVGGDWLKASPTPYPYSLPPNATEAWNAPAAKIDPAARNAFGAHPVVDDVHLAIFQPSASFADFNASFDFTSTAQLASGFFVLRGRSAAHYYMIEFPESGIATRDGFMGVYVSRVGGDTGGRWARGLFVDQLHGVPSECCGVWKTVEITVVGSTLSIWVNGFPVAPLVLAGADGEFAQGGAVGFGTTSGWYAGACPLYIRNFRFSGQAAPAGSQWNTSVASTLGTAWYFPTNASVDYPPAGGAPGPGASSHFPNGMIGYGGTPTKSNGTYWNGFILSKDKGRTWYKGPNILAATITAHAPHAQEPAAEAAAAAAADADAAEAVPQLSASGQDSSHHLHPGLARSGSGNPWAAIGKFITPPIMWYDKVSQETKGYWISPKP